MDTQKIESLIQRAFAYQERQNQRRLSINQRRTLIEEEDALLKDELQAVQDVQALASECSDIDASELDRMKRTLSEGFILLASDLSSLLPIIRKCEQAVGLKESQSGTVAVQLSPEAEKAVIQNVFIQRLASADWPAAYWLSSGLTSPAIPTWVLKACLYGSLLTEDGQLPIEELEQVWSQHPIPVGELREAGFTEPQAHLLLLCACIQPVLWAPQVIPINWLDIAENVPPLISGIVKALGLFARRGKALIPAVLQSVRDGRVHESEIQKPVQSALDWLNDPIPTGLRSRAKLRKILYQYELGVGPVGRAISKVAHDDRTAVDTVREVLQMHFSSYEKLAKDVQAQIHSAQTDSLSPAETTWLGKRVFQTKSFLEEWVNALQLAHSRTSHGQEPYVEQLWKEIEKTLAIMATDLTAISNADRMESALLRAVRVTLERMVRFLAGSSDTLYWKERIRRPLLYLDLDLSPDSDLPEQITQVHALQLARVLAGQETLQEIVERKMARGQFLSASLTVDLLAPARRPMVNAMIAERQAAASIELQKAIEQQRATLERAAIDHVINVAERADLEGRLLSLDKLVSSTRPFNSASLESEICAIAEELHNLRSERARAVQGHIAERREEAHQLEGELRKKALQYEERALNALNRGDLGIADECLGLMEYCIDNGIIPEEPDDRPADLAFDAFRENLSRILEVLKASPTTVASATAPEAHEQTAAANLRRVHDVLGIQAPADEQSMAALVRPIQAFLSIQRSRTLQSTEVGSNLTRIKSVMSFAGFQPRNTPPVKVMTGQYWEHYTLQMSDAEFSPIPQFGSWRNGHYHVLAIWMNSLKKEDIEQVIQATKLSADCPVILYLGRLSLEERQQWGDYCKESGRTVLLIDEPLLYFIAATSGHHLRNLVACSMPWGYANPYTPFGAGNVPPEMFKGRGDIIESLINPYGTAFIYGGRQLGKSAILRAVQRKVHNPAQHKYVLLLDIRTLGAKVSGETTSDIWARIREKAVEAGLIGKSVTPRNLESALRTVVEDKPDTQVYILLDEADHFLDADMNDGFQQVSRLKSLIEDTSRHIKVVFSGLQSVGRFARIPNQPLAHFGPPTPIRPFKPVHARALITEPLAMLGYKLQSDDVVFRMLAYTNYHPALIQNFCFELVKAKRSSRPPFEINLNTVEQVFAEQSVCEVMRERFEWTLLLDHRYEILVYAMVFDQLQAKDGYRKKYTVSDICDLIGGLEVEQTRTLLEELCDLGVLVRLEKNGAYRLRNANVVRALGSPKDIEAKLWRELEAPSDPPVASVGLRAPLSENDDAQSAWSPFTLEQEAALQRDNCGVHLFFALPAHGSNHLVTTLQRLVNVRSVLRQGDAIQVPQDCNSLDYLLSFIGASLDKKGSGRYFFLITADRFAKWEVPIPAVLEQTKSLLSSKQARSRSVNCLFHFQGEGTISWFQLPQELRRRWLDLVGSSPAGSVWSLATVDEYLNRYGMLSTQAAKDAVINNTGGWPMLVEELHHGLVTGGSKTLEGRDPAKQARSLFARLSSPDDDLRRRFLSAIEFDSFLYGRAILEALGKQKLPRSEVLGRLRSIPAAPDRVRAELDAMIHLGMIADDGGLMTDKIVRAVLQL